MIPRVIAALILTAALTPWPVVAARHEIVHKGTVISADAKAVRVSVPDEKTKKSESMTFDHDKDTKVLRGDKVVSFAEARIRKGERISVTINHDDDPTFALVIRLDEK